MSLPTIPAPDDDVVLLHGAAGQTGPFSRRTVQKKLADGEIAGTDFFWFDGLDGWKTLQDHPELLEGLVIPEAPGLDGPPLTQDDQLDALFGDLVKKSWDYFNAHEYAGTVDEVFLGAVITSTLDNGYSLIDLSSDGNHHYLRFENLQDHTRVVYRLTHLTRDLTVAKVQGQRASVLIGYGERAKNFATVWRALQAEWKSGFIQSAEPGTITVDGDMDSQYLYVQVDLYLDLDDYIGSKYQIDYTRLTRDLGAATHALRKYLRGRFGA